MLWCYGYAAGMIVFIITYMASAYRAPSERRNFARHGLMWFVPIFAALSVLSLVWPVLTIHYAVTRWHTGICVRCLSPNPSRATFCGHCGAALDTLHIIEGGEVIVIERGADRASGTPMRDD